MSEQCCTKHDFYYSPGHITDVVCPLCEIDRLNKEINRLRQYEDAVTSAADGTLLVWNLMSTNHTVIKNDYWQNHLEEIDRLKGELEEAYTKLAISIKERIDLGNQLAEARAEIETSNLRSVELIQQAYQNAARSILNDPLVTTYIAPDGLIYKQLLKRYGLEG